MNSFSQKLNELLEKRPSSLRRKCLKEKMSVLETQGYHCFDCTGAWCCTFEYNSMRVTPLEAYDLYSYLEKNNLINDELIEKLIQCQKHYRLDKEISAGRGTELRRTYTCPFFAGETLGCTISRDAKPYGCLAFNALEKGVRSRGYCESNKELLESQDRANDSDKKMNQLLIDELKLNWSKKDIPTALLSLLRINE